MPSWKWMRFHKAQKETVARSGENIGTMLIGGLLLQWFLGTGRVDTESMIFAVLAAVVFLRCSHLAAEGYLMTYGTFALMLAGIYVVIAIVVDRLSRDPSHSHKEKHQH